MKIAIVDDDIFWRQKAEYVIDSFLGIDVPSVDTYANGESFLHADTFYDLVFMDIEMERVDGLSASKTYKEKYPDVYVILLTTHTEWVTKGYEVNAFRYIFKEHMSQKIPEALRDYQMIVEKERTVTVNVVGLGEMPIHIKNIVYITTDRRNIRIHTKTKDYISSAGMQEMEDELAPYGFFRTHKSFLVNICEVDAFDKRDIWMKDKSIAYMSSRKYAEFKVAYLEEKMKMSNG
ncbi:MAG: LytTR family DNA-binding domain-containing protein [Lachnospiraceae bacterium]|nr:LytTR family DNA-binding domain-containing protein [Lachnospiraceae bacterium]